MPTPIKREIEKCRNLIKQLKSSQRVFTTCEDAHIIRPSSDGEVFKDLDTPTLTLMALVHGNEVYGIKVLNQILSYLGSNLIRAPFSIAVALGNTQAALEGLRFREQDLNRCFNDHTSQTEEARRARELAPILAKTSYLMDFHQTILPTKTPFFIFPYTDFNFIYIK